MTGYCTCVVSRLGDGQRLPGDTLRFTPISGSRLNMVEIITRQAVRRNTHRSVMDLTAAIGTLIYGWNGASPLAGPRPLMSHSRLPNPVNEPCPAD